MNLKALITTLVLGSSSIASADSLAVSGSVKVSLGARSGGVVRDYHSSPYRPAPTHRPVVVADDCNDPNHAHPQAVESVWRGTWFNITNTVIAPTASHYRGWLATSPLMRASVYNRGAYRSQHAWFDLTEATRIDSGRQFFTLGTDKGTFRGLRLHALGNGRTNLQQVGVEYFDAYGQIKTQKVRLNSFIDRSNPTITIDIEGGYRAINRIIVYGTTDRGSAYKIQAT